MPLDIIYYLLSFSILLALSSLFSGLEAAILSLKPIHIAAASSESKTVADNLRELSANREKYLPTLLIANNLVNILFASISAALFLTLMGGFGMLLSAALSTLIIIIFGEILPKTYATKNPGASLKPFFSLIKNVYHIMQPIVYLLNIITKPIISRYVSKQKFLDREEHIEALLKEADLRNSNVAELASNFASNLDTTKAYEVMIPANKFVKIDGRTTISTFMDSALRLYNPLPKKIPIVMSKNQYGFLWLDEVLSKDDDVKVKRYAWKISRTISGNCTLSELLPLLKECAIPFYKRRTGAVPTSILLIVDSSNRVVGSLIQDLIEDSLIHLPESSNDFPYRQIDVISSSAMRVEGIFSGADVGISFADGPTFNHWLLNQFAKMHNKSPKIGDSIEINGYNFEVENTGFGNIPVKIRITKK